MNEKIIEDAAALSSGTLATLTGKNKYADIDEIQTRFVEFVFAYPRKLTNWMVAWELFWNNTFIYVMEITACSDVPAYMRGDDVTEFYKTLSGARACAANYARENWYLDCAIPKSEEQVIEMYFDSENQQKHGIGERLQIYPKKIND